MYYSCTTLSHEDVRLRTFVAIGATRRYGHFDRVALVSRRSCTVVVGLHSVDACGVSSGKFQEQFVQETLVVDG